VPSPLEVIAQVRVRATPEKVWAVAMDWSRQGEWIPATQVRGGTGVGARVVARTAVGPVGFTDTMVITEWDPPRRCVVRHTDGWSWQEIAFFLGVSKQAVHKKHSRRLGR
jgi:uncharacterized protein YndB with AHSA1/START domain